MSPDTIVETFGILKDGLPGVSPTLEASAVNAFCLEGTEEGLSDRIIVTVASSTHADGDVCFRTQGLISVTGLLRSSVGMEEEPRLWTPAEQGHTQSAFD